ncbi:Uncharacterized protein dnm_027410 [Desulfonema magnum]|uniref:Uncharacterized protein n=1 Tax=Desulfonema magnum TaxID=45655 RepID=A0A975BK26_9BACT|nr:Uncharacterized protein dnm_027410 [Desulfonema magnum]
MNCSDIYHIQQHSTDRKFSEKALKEKRIQFGTSPTGQRIENFQKKP